MTTQEKIEVMQAYAEGKEIQTRCKTDMEWADWVVRGEPKWNWEDLDYRIKPESTCRPYKDTEEMIEDFKKRFNVEVPPYAMPMIWVIKKVAKVRGHISEFSDSLVTICGVAWDTDKLFDRFTYLDGSPCGMNEEL